MATLWAFRGVGGEKNFGIRRCAGIIAEKEGERTRGIMGGR